MLARGRNSNCYSAELFTADRAVGYAVIGAVSAAGGLFTVFLFGRLGVGKLFDSLALFLKGITARPIDIAGIAFLLTACRLTVFNYISLTCMSGGVNGDCSGRFVCASGVCFCFFV